ncbi:MAG: hypothetical protein VCE75_22625 [Alphaproteobacteria bacterium]
MPRNVARRGPDANQGFRRAPCRRAATLAILIATLITLACGPRAGVALQRGGQPGRWRGRQYVRRDQGGQLHIVMFQLFPLPRLSAIDEPV